jgi:hypothetical protein
VGEAARGNRRVLLVIDYADMRAMPGIMPQP